MFEKLHSFLARHIPISDEQFVNIKPLFIPKNVKKGEFLLREGDIAKYSMFVASGCLRNYIIDNKGKEHILQFSPENWWTGDMNSFMNEIPTQHFIDAIEDSEILLTEKDSLQKLYEFVPGSANFYQIALQKSLVAKNETHSFLIERNSRRKV